MRKFCYCIIALNCLFWGCSSENTTATNDRPDSPGTPQPSGEECPDNTDANYADDEYSEIHTGDENLKISLKRNKRCSDEYPYCRSTSEDAGSADEGKYYCAHCKSGEIYDQNASGEDACTPCQDLIEHEDQCTTNECFDMLNRCRFMMHGETVVDNLSAEQSIFTIYYDMPRKLGIIYRSKENSVKDIKLKIVQRNNCVDFLTDPLVTNDKGIAYLEMKPKNDCHAGKKVKVCLEEDEELCTEFLVRTTSDNSEIDTNGNLMIDEFENNSKKDKAKFSNYVPGDCNSFCHDDAQCEKGFCDSAIGYKCSVRCTSDDQCIKYEDHYTNKLEQAICRKAPDGDGRCAYPYFLAIYDVKKDGTILMGGQPVGEVKVDWGDGIIETLPATPPVDSKYYKHTYSQEKKYDVKIYGDFRNWTAGCSRERGVDIENLKQFGTIGLGWNGNPDFAGWDDGSFTNCFYDDFETGKISAKDIPDATKLTNMNSMFGGNNGKPGYTFFDSDISRWDTRNVTSMYHTFINTGDGNLGKHVGFGFNQDIGRWDVSKVKNMEGMFLGSQEFNQDITCWDTSSVEDISRMFWMAKKFNQNLEKNKDLGRWNLKNLRKHNFVFKCENGKNGAISLENYCKFRSVANNENIGRDGGGSEDPCIDEVGYGSACCAAQCYRTPHEGLCEGYVDHWCGIPAAGQKGYDYKDGCSINSNGKPRYEDLVGKCLTYLNKTKEFGHYTSDMVTCHHLRVCRTCAFVCHKCRQTEGCDITNVYTITKEEQEKQKKETGHYDTQVKCECEHFSADSSEAI